MNKLPEISEFLICPTPKAWLVEAANQRTLILTDHANCEKKAAAAALHLLHCYVEQDHLLHKMARLAREELLHFQKVIQLMQKRQMRYSYLRPGRYAQKLRALVSINEPQRLADLLMIGALIEARSCERFEALSPFLADDPDLQKFYQNLCQAEARHFHDYLKLAYDHAPDYVAKRLPEFQALEAELITSPDPVFRFHSGLPTL